MTMPGLPRVPAADSIKLNKNGGDGAVREFVDQILG